MDFRGRDIRHYPSGFCSSTCQSNASFSSVLLDAIYRSIDDERAASAPMVFAEEDIIAPVLKKHIALSHGYHKEERGHLKSNLRIDYRRPEELKMKKLAAQKSYSSSDSSSSLSEWPIPPSLPKRSSELPFQYRKNMATKNTTIGHSQASDQKKTKKNKPVSPGSRLASFLNSLYKKTKRPSSSRVDLLGDDSSSQRLPSSTTMTPTSSTCSSASSCSRRSCLSNSSSENSGGRSVDGVKRSVRFYPFTTIILDKGRECLLDEDLIELLPRDRRTGMNQFGAPQFDVLSEYKKKFGFYGNQGKEDDDLASDCSSDLFELENLGEISMKKYDEELPVYETTDLNRNLAIANGLLL